MDAIVDKLPKDGSLSRNDVKMICKDQVFDVLNSKDDRLKTTKFNEDILSLIHELKVDIAKIRVGGSAELFDKKETSPNKASFTAGQALMQEKKLSKDSLTGVLNESELNMVNNMLGT